MYQLGDIVLVKPKNFIQKLIAKLTKSNYSHCVIVCKLDPNLILDIDYTKSRIRTLSYYDDRGYDVFRLKGGLTPEQGYEATKWIQNNLDVPYDFVQLLSYLNRILFKINRITNIPDKFVCSEMVDRMYHHIGIDLVSNYEIGDVTPEDLKCSELLFKVS